MEHVCSHSGDEKGVQKYVYSLPSADMDSVKIPWGL